MQSQGALSFTELVLNASFLVQCVMLFLLGLSVASWTIIISRNNQYRLGRAKADDFEERFWSGIDLNNLYQECMERPDELVGLEVIYSAGFKEFVRLVNSGPADQDVVMDGTYRQMKVACSREVELLENHLPMLATIGSISPYIGLFGTVWGIMHAFVALAAVKNATLAMVAPPIAEALIATAMGLFAAIPAVMFYNRFTTKVEALENRYYNFMDEFSTILNRRLVTIRTQLNRQSMPQGRPMQQMNQGMSQHNMQNSYAQGQEGHEQADTHESESEMPVQAQGLQQTMQNSQNMVNDPRKVQPQQGMQGQGQGQMPGQMPQGQMQGQMPGQMPQNRAQNQAFNNKRPAAPMPNNDPRMAASFRGVVPPRNNAQQGNMAQAQLPGGAAMAVKPNARRPLPPNANGDAPFYKAGSEFDNRSRPAGTDEEPHYITPGGQNQRRAPEGEGSTQA